MHDINQFDLAIVVDTTGSMGGLIAAAQRQLVELVDRLAAASDIDMRLGVVEYRDHPPQDKLTAQAYDFTDNLARAKRTINGLSANGGGDAPEAVFAGIVTALDKLSWRPQAFRITVLVGDAPPHGVGCPGDAFRYGCPSGETIESVGAKAEEARVTLYAIALTQQCEASFERLSRQTGGQVFRADHSAAIAKLEAILQAVFGDIQFDRRVHEAWNAASEPTVDSLAIALGEVPSRIAASICRLQSRGFLGAPSAPTLPPRQNALTKLVASFLNPEP